MNLSQMLVGMTNDQKLLGFATVFLVGADRLANAMLVGQGQVAQEFDLANTLAMCRTMLQALTTEESIAEMSSLLVMFNKNWDISPT